MLLPRRGRAFWQDGRCQCQAFCINTLCRLPLEGDLDRARISLANARRRQADRALPCRRLHRWQCVGAEPRRCGALPQRTAAQPRSFDPNRTFACRVFSILGRPAKLSKEPAEVPAIKSPTRGFLRLAPAPAQSRAYSGKTAPARVLLTTTYAEGKCVIYSNAHFNSLGVDASFLNQAFQGGTKQALGMLALRRLHPIAQADKARRRR